MATATFSTHEKQLMISNYRRLALAICQQAARDARSTNEKLADDGAAFFLDRGNADLLEFAGLDSEALFQWALSLGGE